MLCIRQRFKQFKIKSHKCNCKCQSLQLSWSWAGPSSCMSIQFTWDIGQISIMVTAHMQDKFNERSEYINLKGIPLHQQSTWMVTIQEFVYHFHLCIIPVTLDKSVKHLLQIILGQNNINLPHNMLFDPLFHFSTPGNSKKHLVRHDFYMP